MASCEKCGATVSETAKFCDSCGAPTPGHATEAPGTRGGSNLGRKIWKVVKWGIIGIVVVFLFLLVLGLIINATTPPPNCGSVYCKAPNQCCNNTCYQPCNTGYFLGDDCKCHVNGSFSCGSGYCNPDTECCKGTCYDATPPGYIRVSDCSIVPAGSELCNGMYYKPCPAGYNRAPDDCSCYPEGSWVCNGVYYKPCGPGFYPSYLDCTCTQYSTSLGFNPSSYTF
jgi:hypothetical protein